MKIRPSSLIKSYLGQTRVRYFVVLVTIHGASILILDFYAVQLGTISQRRVFQFYFIFMYLTIFPVLLVA